MQDLTLYDHRSSICSQMARLALAEKGLAYQRREIDIMDTSEQFEPWYVSLNPRAVVPTLKIGDEVVTDTIRIVNRVQSMGGPDLAGNERTQTWLSDIMALHYGVLMYRNRLDADGAAPQIVARGKLLTKLARERPELGDLIAARIEGNQRFQKLLRSPDGIDLRLSATRDLIDRMAQAIEGQMYLSGGTYSLADCFATAALARFIIHRLDPWWSGTPLQDYYERMKERPSFREAEVIDTGTERDL